MEAENLLEISSLCVRYPGAEATALRDVELVLKAGQITCVIGESGSGKSTLFHSILQLPGRVEITQGSVRFRGNDLKAMPKQRLRELRGKGIGAVFQEPGASLDPIRPIRRQFYETLRAHDAAVTVRKAEEKAEEILRALEFSDPHRILKSCPAQLSGGMNQRVAIALAMAPEPDILLCDEPTSALDVTVQAQIVEELMRLRETFGTCILLITHNMGVVAKMADHVAVMYGGRIVEYGPRKDVLHAPAHPYTRALMEAIPTLDGRTPKGIPGRRPDVFPEKGCAFAPRCRMSCKECETRGMIRHTISGDHWTLCPEEVNRGD
ncbi:MAG: ABC transporter ATP-binding protein [Oscillospiraceae bacterium]|nr:ABC transporter ATP-binding protein [Oscillospiraceae bacterium]